MVDFNKTNGWKRSMEAAGGSPFANNLTSDRASLKETREKSSYSDIANHSLLFTFFSVGTSLWGCSQPSPDFGDLARSPALVEEGADDIGEGEGVIAEGEGPIGEGEGEGNIGEGEGEGNIGEGEGEGNIGEGEGEIPNPVDTDEDGVPDDIDNCPLLANPNQHDTDQDNVGNDCDNCPTWPNVDQRDSDANNIGNACQDNDRDGIIDDEDNCPLVNNATAPNQDHDLIPDDCDDDSDGDGDVDDEDNCPGVNNATAPDQDQDLIPDVCDDDIDGDTVVNHTDNCPLVANEDQADTFGQPNFGDACETDNDEDGVLNEADNCREIANPDQRDRDDDQVGNVCDNCPAVANADQQNSDIDPAGDVCDHPPVIGNRSPIEGESLLPQVSDLPDLFNPAFDANSQITLSAEVSDLDHDFQNCRMTLTDIYGDGLDFVDAFLVGGGNPNVVDVDFLAMGRSSIQWNIAANQFSPRQDYCWEILCGDAAGNAAYSGLECFTTSDFDLVLWLRFNQADDMGYDSSGFENHAQIVGDVGLISGEELAGGEGMNGSGIILIEGGGHLVVPYSPELNPTNAISIGARFLTFNPLTNDGILSGPGWSMLSTEHYPGRINCIFNAETPVSQQTPSTVVERTLYNAMCTYDASAAIIKAHVNEILRQNIAGGLLPLDPLQGITIGNVSVPAGYNHFDGVFDDIQIYRRSLSTESVHQLFCELDGFEGPTCPPE